MKVNFIVAGCQKGGTTSLDIYFRRHPEIRMAKVKELHYFDTDRSFISDKLNYSSYHRLFSSKRCNQIYGEVTPSYMYLRDVPHRILEYNPEMKIIVVLRNPIERAYSHWNMQRHKGCEKLPFLDAVKREEVILQQSLKKQSRRFSYIDRGFYVKQLLQIWCYFDKSQTCIIKSDDLMNDRVATLNSIFNFLDVSRVNHVSLVTANSLSYERKMTQSERTYLFDIYHDEIKTLELLLGWECGDWIIS
ncbi:MAG: sulfotransferase domain-containing protein [Sedimenticola sp.]